MRAITSDLINQDDLPYKYRNDLYASEIVPLAYYIAGINIENAYHERRGDGPYEGFDNLSLTDTFQLSEHKGALSDLFMHNQKRIDRQAELDFLAIVGNPPYVGRTTKCQRERSERVLPARRSAHRGNLRSRIAHYIKEISLRQLYPRYPLGQ